MLILVLYYNIATTLDMEPLEQAQFVGESVTITCMTSDPSWTKDGQSLPGDVILEGNEIHISDVTLEHAGTYTCTSPSASIDDEEQTSGSSKLYIGGNCVSQ